MPVFNRARKLAIPVRPFVLQRPLFKKNLKLPTQPNPINTASLSLLSSWLNLLYLRFVGLGKELFKSVVLVWVIWALVGSLQLLQVGFAQLHRSLRAGPLMTAGLLVLHSVNKRINTPASKSPSLATHLNMSSRKLGFAFRGFTWAKFSRSNFWVSLMFRGAIFTLGNVGFEEPSSNKTKLCVFLLPCCQWVLFWLAFQTCLIVLVVELHTLIVVLNY